MTTVPPPPGDVVDIDGYRLHLQRQGEGSPPVVLEAALGDCSLSWALVQPQVATFTTAYSYDRAGLAWSEASSRPRTATNIVAELHTLLQAAAVELPVVLVAHSFGGLVARLYAHLHPDDVAGLVLVDAAPEDQDRDAPAGLQPLLAMSHTADELRQMPLFVPSGLPSEVTTAYQALIAANRSIDAFIGDMMGVEDSRPEVRDAGITTLGPILVIALRHGIPPAFPPEPGIQVEAQQEYEATWQGYQSGFADLSSSGQVRVAHGARHMIPHEAPDNMVTARTVASLPSTIRLVAAICDIVEMARRRPSARLLPVGER